MAEVILMPRLSDTMTEGVIAAWHKKVGDKVKKGELLAEIETDKATMDLESYKDGTLLHVGGDKGSKIQVDDLLAILGNPGEDVSGLIKGKSSGAGKPDMQKPVTKETDTPDKGEGDVPPAGQGSSSIDLSKMEEVVLMPRLSDTMTEGVIAAWHKKVGDPVKKGELLAEIETDKATMELESYKEGTLLHIGGDKGAKINVDDLLAIIGSPGEDISQHVSGNKGGSKEQASSQQPQAQQAPSAQPQTQTAKPEAPGMDLGKMEEVVLMPRLSDTMTEGVIAGWHKNVGDAVKKGDVLADIETDKATMELESYKNGTLLFQGAKQGEKIN